MYYDAIRYEFEFSTGVWTEVSSYVINADRGSMGIQGWGPLDRVAATGSFSFNLRNVDNLFTPGHINCMSGFEAGVAFRLVFELDDKERTRFYGKVPADGIEVGSASYFSVTTVTVVDYMEQAAIHELDLPTFDEDLRSDEIVPLIIANMPIAPLATDYDTGQDTFATVFDTVKTRTRALQELSKLANSELGYIYIRQSWEDDEVLVAEGRQSRVGTALDQYHVWDGVIDELVTEDGEVIVTEDDEPIIMEYVYDFMDAIFDDCFTDHKLSHGNHYYNHVKVTAHPRRVDAAATTVLFNLERVISIGAGETERIKVGFRDPAQEAVSVAGIDMVTPVATTDYTMNAAEDGSGADLTANLDVTATYGVNGVEYELENTGGTLGYVTKLQARGKGVYTYQPVAIEESYDAGITADGKRTLNLDLIYQDNPLVASDFAIVFSDLYAQKRTVVESITMIANANAQLLNAFIDLSVGSKIEVVIESADVDAEYYIHAIQFTIAPHGIVIFTYGLFPAALAPSEDFWLIGDAGFSEIGETTVIGF